MTITRIEPREKIYEELIERQIKLDCPSKKRLLKIYKPRVTFDEKDIKIPRKERIHNKKGNREDQKARLQERNHVSCER